MENNTSQALADTTAPIASTLAPSGEVGTPLFLINLCASMAPVQPASKTLPGLESYKLYQVQRVEDGRTRYRLRLGFFATEAEAEEVLLKVREQYPTAFTACLCDEDRRFTRGYVMPQATKPALTVVSNTSGPAKHVANPEKSARVDSSAQATVAPQSATRVTTAPKPSQPSTPAQASSASKPHKPGVALSTMAPRANERSATAGDAPEVASGTATSNHTLDAAASRQAKAPELTLSDPPAPPASRPRTTPNEPFHVGKGAQIPSTQLSLAGEPAPSAPATGRPSAPMPAISAQPASGANKPAATAPSPAPSEQTSSTGHAQVANHPDLDSTQTIRALTAEELNDEGTERWFAIQLAVSEQPVNLETMPHLDIFEAYRLYSVATAGSGKITHSLRLGFFKEAVSAEAVAGYLKTFFSSPTVLRISVAEHARFKDATLPKRPAPVENKQNVIELETARSARAAAVPTVTMEVAPGPDTSATGSFRSSSTGSFRTSDTAMHRTLSPGIKPAAKHATPATKRSAPLARKKNATTGKYKSVQKKSLAEQLLEEAKEVELSESGIYKMPKSESLLSRLVDRFKK